MSDKLFAIDGVLARRGAEKVVEQSTSAFLEHFGTKGMKWGVRKENSTGHVTKVGAKGFRLLDGPLKTRIYEETNAHMNKINLPKINSSAKYQGKDLRNSPTLRSTYHKDVAAAYKKSWDGSTSNQTLVKQNRPTIKTVYEYGNGRQFNTFRVVATTALFATSALLVHADSANDLVLTLHYDDLGHIVLMTPQVVSHLDEDSAFLQHFGKKGMKWGVVHPRGSDGLVTIGKKLPSDSKEISKIKSKVAKAGGSTSSLSNKDFKTLLDRMDLERRYAQHVAENKPKKKPDGFFAKVIKKQGDHHLNYAGNKLGEHFIDKFLHKKFGIEPNTVKKAKKANQDKAKKAQETLHTILGKDGVHKVTNI